jgi:C4-dicarboxylate transporter DctM subunit
VILALYGIIYALKNKIPVTCKFNARAFLVTLRLFLDAYSSGAYFGGIYGGFVTATEAAALAVVYALIIEVFCVPLL